MESVATNEYLRNDLRERGIRRVEQFRWENTARATVEAYRSAVMRPSPRSLQMRRSLREGILRWAVHVPHDAISSPHEVPENDAPIDGHSQCCRGSGLAFNDAAEAKATNGTVANIGAVQAETNREVGFPGRPSARSSGRGIEQAAFLIRRSTT